MTVIMKLDLVGPRSRGLAIGLNEFAGYLSVGLTAFFAGYISRHYSLRPQPIYPCIGYAVLGLAFSILLMRDTGHRVGHEITNHASASETIGLWGVFWRPSF